ncbi:hypothetical protein AB0D46_06730 [Streptomyces sp. NPDC048383]|uniref:hypothetical protein n=1 Tax=Streptomyces sp. NPDC048383 TaxID=3155386 RepID=UPI003434996F
MRPRGREWLWPAGIAKLNGTSPVAAFPPWYRTVAAVGAGRPGLLTGVAPLAAAAVDSLTGGGVPGPAVWRGLAVVVAGLALVLRPEPVARDGRGIAAP